MIIYRFVKSTVFKANKIKVTFRTCYKNNFKHSSNLTEIWDKLKAKIVFTENYV